jgi:Tfp pilus assembly protein PilF
VSGETRLGAREQLSQCLSQLIQGNNPTPQVLQCYDQVLKSDPANVEARTYKAGLSVMVNHDVSAVNELISVATSDPSYPDVHAFLAIAFSQLGRPDSALAELKKLDTLNPTPLMRDLVADLRTTLESTTTTTTTP